MMRSIFVALALGAAGSALAQSAPTPAPAGKVLEQSAEYRFQLDLHVSEAALAKFLPAGWAPNVAATGAAKDCNLRLIFIDRTNIVGPDNRPVGAGADRLVYLAAPVKGPSAQGQMVIGGLSEKADTADSGYGVLLKARNVKVSRSMTVANARELAIEDWAFTGPSGETVRMHVRYTPAAANKATSSTMFFDPKNPSRFRVFEVTNATDITRNVTTTPQDRVKEFSLKAGGGSLASLFDGSERVLSWDSQRWYVRTIVDPAS